MTIPAMMIPARRGRIMIIPAIPVAITGPAIHVPVTPTGVMRKKNGRIRTKVL